MENEELKEIGKQLRNIDITLTFIGIIILLFSLSKC